MRLKKTLESLLKRARDEEMLDESTRGDEDSRERVGNKKKICDPVNLTSGL